MIPVLRPKLPEADKLLPYLRRIDASRVYSNFGPLSLEFQARLAERLRVRPDEIVCTSCGTTALIAAILATAGPARGDKPLAAFPAFTFAATATAAERCGYRPLFVDVERETWEISPEALLAHPSLNEIGLVVVVGPFGKAPAPEPWLRFQAETGICVVIDGAASFALYESLQGSRFSEIPVALSFHATKSLGIGEGGAVVWKAPQACESITRAINFGFYCTRDSQASSMNGKLNEYNAAVGLAALDGWADRRRELLHRIEAYREYFAKARIGAFIGFPDIDLIYPLFLCDAVSSTKHFESALIDADIGYRFWYGEGLHKQAYFKQYHHVPLPVTEDIAGRAIGLPMAPDLEIADIRRTVAEVLGASAEELRS